MIVNRNADFFLYKTNRDSKRFESIRIANQNALVVTTAMSHCSKIQNYCLILVLYTVRLSWNTGR